MGGTANMAWVQGQQTASTNGFYRSLTLDQPASDLTDFPVLFYGTFTYLKTTGNGGKVNNASGYDIVFYSDVALTTKLKFERVSWDGATGDVEFWVKVPTLTSASALVIYLAYGNTTISTDQQDKNGTWNTNFISVWHMDDASAPATDSTSNALDAAMSGTVTFGATGQIKSGTSYNNNIANFLSLTSATFNFTSALTISGWVFSSSFISFHGILDKTIGGATNTQYQLFLQGDVPLFRLTKSSVNTTLMADAALSNNTWYHLVATWDGTTMKMYVNNSIQTSTPALASPIDSGSGAIFIGQLGSSVFPFNGTIDELRVANTGRNADWVAAEYSNQNDPANFYAIGSEANV